MATCTQPLASEVPYRHAGPEEPPGGRPVVPTQEEVDEWVHDGREELCQRGQQVH